MSRKKECDDEQAETRRTGGNVETRGGVATDVASEGHYPLERLRAKLMSGFSLSDKAKDEVEIIEEINATIRVIEELRAEAHKDDEEMKRLGDETRRLIAELLKELKVA